MSDDARPVWQAPEVPDRAPAPASADGRPDLPLWWAGFASLVAGYVLANVVSAFIVLATGKTGGPAVNIGGTYALDASFLVLAFVFARMGSAVAPRVALGLRRPADPRRAFGIAAAAFVAFFVVGGVYGLLLGIDDASEQTVDALGLRDSTLNLVLSAGVLVVGAPIVEEVLFRGLIFGALWRRFGLPIGVIASGLTFGLVHAGGAVLVALPILAGLGVVLALLYRYTGSLLPGIALHALNNSITLAVTVDGWASGARVLLVVGAVALTTLIAWAIAAPARSVLRSP